MKNLQATYATTPANGDAIPFDWDAFSMVETNVRSHHVRRATEIGVFLRSPTDVFQRLVRTQFRADPDQVSRGRGGQ